MIFFKMYEDFQAFLSKMLFAHQENIDFGMKCHLQITTLKGDFGTISVSFSLNLKEARKEIHIFSLKPKKNYA